jgi:hypothetical protein
MHAHILHNFAFQMLRTEEVVQVACSHTCHRARNLALHGADAVEPEKYTATCRSLCTRGSAWARS